MFAKLLDIQYAKQETLHNDFEVRPEGHLVLMTCGHRGQPSRSEEKRISRLMRKSGFIPMLEDMPIPMIKSQGAPAKPLSASQEQLAVQLKAASNISF